MTKLLWDQSGERRYEAGCDRGVLYLPDQTAVVWNGLTSVEEDFSDTTVEEYYLDGVKYLNRRVPGDYAGTLKALTYPDEFMQFDGVQEYEPGILIGEQPVNKTFGLSYRTKIGDDLNGVDAGSKIHLLYNLTALPDTRSFSSQAGTAAGEEFSWKLSGVPIVVPGYRPAVHITIDSTRVVPGSLADFEDYLYGSDDTSPQMPDIAKLQELQSDTITDLIAVRF